MSPLGGVFSWAEVCFAEVVLSSIEVSIRILETNQTGMIADIELEIFAHKFQDRVDKQDEICLNVRKYVMKLRAPAKDVRVWLVLSELGHSWE